MPIIKTDLGVIDVQDDGDGPPIVCVHGSFSNSSAWRPLQNLLESSYRIVAPNMWGCGRTDDWPHDATPTIESQAALVAATIDHVNEPVHLIGHSHGGVVALGTALDRSGMIKSMVLLDPLPCNALLMAGDQKTYSQLHSFYEDYVEAFERGDASAGSSVVDYWTGPGTFDKLPDKIKDHIRLSTPLNIKDWQANWAFEPAADSLKCLVVPTTVVWGNAGNQIGSAIGRSLEQLLANATYVELASASHLMVSTHTDAVAKLIIDHVVASSSEG